MSKKGSGAAKRIVAFVLVVVFVYLVVTSSQFRGYAVKKVETTNTSLSISINDTEQFYNTTEYMNESTFLGWSENHTNNTVVSNVLSGSKNYSEGLSKLEALWKTINSLYASSATSYNAASQLYAQIKNTSGG